MLIVNRRVAEIFIMLIFGVTALSAVVGVENTAGGSVVKIGFPFSFYQQTCTGAQCAYGANTLMIMPNALIYFGIAAGYVNFKARKKHKTIPAPLLSKPKKQGFCLFKKKQLVKPSVTTFFDSKAEEKKPEIKVSKNELEYKPSKFDVADEEPLFTKDELEETKDDSDE
ncbi:MAG: hypothetical protein HY513_05705 [Candidatus Aenigmarchaeota archaeon]|nr:hypothetical protein [Candidatus Aenigmarchaeota archaeon]